jgi:hypothetical protein
MDSELQRLGVAAVATVASLGLAVVLSPVIYPALFVSGLYKDRMKDWQAQQSGKPVRPYHLDKPTRWEAFRDLAEFDIRYMASFSFRDLCGRVNTTNWDFEGRLKRKAGYQDPKSVPA